MDKPFERSSADVLELSGRGQRVTTAGFLGHTVPVAMTHSASGGSKAAMTPFR